MMFSRKAVFAAASLLAAFAVTSVPVKADDQQHPPGKDEKNKKPQGGEQHNKQPRPPGPGPQGHRERPNNQERQNNPAVVKKPPPSNVQKKQFGNGGPGGNPNAIAKPKPPGPPKPPVINNAVKVPPPQQGGKPNTKFGADKNKQNFQKQFGNQGKDRGPGNKPVVINPAPLNKPAAANNVVVPRVMPAKPLSAADAKKRFENMRGARKEVKIDGGKGVVIEEPGKRRIIKENNRLVIQHDENERLKRVDPQARFVKGKGGTNIAVINRPGGVKVYSETDSNGQLVRRYRRGPDGRDVTIIDNRRRRGNVGRDIAAGIGIVAGAAILGAILDVPEPHIGIPRDQYIVDYDRASDDDVYDALSAPPVEEFSDRYTLDEIRATASLRDRMRRIDLNDITFEFGSWDVDPGQYGKLERIAHAMQRIIDRNPNEVFMIEGYTDAVGSPEDNLSLSDRRAESVAEVLTDQFQIPFENLTTQGYGEQYLKVPTDGPERLNRRVAVRRITPLLANGSGPPPPPGAGQPPPDDQSGGPDDGGPDSGGPDDGGSDQGPPPPPGSGGPQD